MATQAEDRDTLEALKSYWDATPSLYNAGGMFLSRVVKSPKTSPYVKGECRPGQSVYFAPVQSGKAYIDTRNVTVTGYGDESQMSALAVAIRAKLNFLPRDSMTLTFPSEAGLMVVRPINGSPRVESDETTKDGKDVFRCVAEFEIQTTRLVA